ncbi:MAG TPA: amino acid permease [Terriglobales bacterium]|nr:amino acid permease [Terriglobales bacterium]
MAIGTSPTRATLSVLDAVAIIVGIVVGAGLFETPQMVAANAGSKTMLVLVWVAGGALSLLGALCYAELATAYPDTGGMYFYIKRAFGQAPAFLLAWSRLLVIQTGSIALLGFVLGDYASQVFNLGRHSPAIYAATAVIVLTFANVRGVRLGRWMQNSLSLAKVAAVVAVTVTGFMLPAAPSGPAVMQTTAPQSSIGLMMIFVLLTYGGWQEAGYIAAEVKDTRRSMVKALLYSIGIITVIFVAVNAALVHGLGLTGMANSRAVVADVLRLGMGPSGAIVVSIAVMVAALGSMQGTIFTGARTNFALGRDFRMFRGLAQWNESGQTPTRALLVQGGIALLLVLLGTTTRHGFKTMVEYTAPVFWLFVFLTGLALIILRIKEPEIERPFRVPLYPLTPILFSATSAYLLYASLAYTGIGALFGVLVLGAGLAVLYVERRKQRTSTSESRRAA